MLGYQNRPFNGDSSDPAGENRKRETLPVTLAGRIYLLLRAAIERPVISSDDALLDDELLGRRHGNCKLVGQAVAFSHRMGWIQPAQDHQGCRLSIKFARRTRAHGIIELWKRTTSTLDGLVWAKQMMTPLPVQPSLLDFIGATDSAGDSTR